MSWAKLDATRLPTGGALSPRIGDAVPLPARQKAREKAAPVLRFSAAVRVLSVRHERG